MNRLRSKKKGFTLIEILIVISIIGMIMLVGIGSYGVARKKVELDVATNYLQSTIVEARDKTRAGYYEQGQDISNAKSFCFGFLIKKGEFIKPLKTDYDRLKVEGSQCDKQNAKELNTTNKQKNIIVKNIYIYGQDTGSEAEVFFAPPDANVEIEKQLIEQDKPELRVVLGYNDSDEDLDKREVVFNILTGAVYSQTFTTKDENQQ